MNTNDIIWHVMNAITQVQEASGRKVQAMTSDTRPLGDLDGFDSLSSVEATLFLSETLAGDVPDSVFLPENGGQPLSVNEIAKSVYNQVRLGSN